MREVLPGLVHLDALRFAHAEPLLAGCKQARRDCLASRAGG